MMCINEVTRHLTRRKKTSITVLGIILTCSAIILYSKRPAVIFRNHFETTISHCETTVSSAVKSLFSQVTTWDHMKPTINGTISCKLYDAVASQNRTHVCNVFGHPTSVQFDDVTLVTQMSTNKIDRFLMSLENWKGPLSVAVYVTSDHMNSVGTLLCIAPLRNRLNLQLHLVIQQEPGPLYPVNFLRDLAMKAALTKYVFLDDVDMIPGPHVYDSVFLNARHIVGKQVLVVPAMEIDAIPQIFPKTKEDILSLWKQGIVRFFHKKIFAPGQRQSNFSLWTTATQPYTVFWKEYYEPYIIAEKALLPNYPLQFVSRYYDKSAHLQHIAAMKFEFRVLPQDYVLHLDHTSGRFRDVAACAGKVHNKFKKHLVNTYGQYWKTNT